MSKELKKRIIFEYERYRILKISTLGGQGRSTGPFGGLINSSPRVLVPMQVVKIRSSESVVRRVVYAVRRRFINAINSTTSNSPSSSVGRALDF